MPDTLLTGTPALPPFPQTKPSREGWLRIAVEASAMIGCTPTGAASSPTAKKYLAAGPSRGSSCWAMVAAEKAVSVPKNAAAAVVTMASVALERLHVRPCPYNIWNVVTSLKLATA